MFSPSRIELETFRCHTAVLAVNCETTITVGRDEPTTPRGADDVLGKNLRYIFS